MVTPQFESYRLPYPLAQTYLRLPETASDVDDGIGPAESIFRAIFCFETICRFCVWEMVMEYLRLGQEDLKVTSYLARQLLFRSQQKGVATGTWVGLLGHLALHLRSHHDRLFMPEMPFAFWQRQGTALKEVMNRCILPFVPLRNKYGHQESCTTPDYKLSDYLVMRERLIRMLNALAFLQNYCIVSVIRCDQNIVREGHLLEVSDFNPGERPDFPRLKEEIHLNGDHNIHPNTTILVKREALSRGVSQPFLLYPFFLFDKFSPLDSQDMRQFKKLPDEVYILNEVEHKDKILNRLKYVGHRLNCKPKTCEEKSKDPETWNIMRDFCTFLSQAGLSVELPREEGKQVLPFDSFQEDDIEYLLHIHLERQGPQSQLAKFLDGPGGCMIMTGTAGSGKSACAAHLIRSYKAQAPAVNLIYHLIRPYRRNWKNIVASILYQLWERFQSEMPDNFIYQVEDLEDELVMRIYREGLSKVNRFLKQKRQKLLVIIDALDELAASEQDFRIKNLFQFVPIDFMVFDRVYFVLTTRPGQIYQDFKKHLRGRISREFTLEPMDTREILELTALYHLELNPQQMNSLENISQGNPLYLSAVFRLLQEDPAFPISQLPTDVLEFFRGDLFSRLDLKNDALLRDLLAVLKVLREPASASQLAEIFQLPTGDLKDLLYRLGGYLYLSTQETYSFFHLQFENSLNYGEEPILYPEDLKRAHQRIIAWCEPFENCLSLNLGGEERTRFQYGFHHLPYHYWELGPGENFKGFLSLLGRGNVNCEMACRNFFRNLILERQEKDLIEDKAFQQKISYLFKAGNDKAKFALLRLDYDLSPFGYSTFRKNLWKAIIKLFPDRSFWYDEIFLITSVFSDKRLDMCLEALRDSQNITDKEQLKQFYLKVAIHLCNVGYSAERWDPEKGLEYWQKTFEIQDSLTAVDYLYRACDDENFAQYIYNQKSGFVYNDYAISLERISKVDKAIEQYRYALHFKEDNFSSEEYVGYLKTNLDRSISITRHNLAALLILRGNYVEGIDLFNLAILIRAQNRMLPAVTTSLNLFNNLFEFTYLPDMVNFFYYLDIVTKQPNSPQARIEYLEKCFTYYLAVTDYEKAEAVEHELAILRESHQTSHLDSFKLWRNRVRLALLKQEDELALNSLNLALKMLREYGEWRIFVRAGTNYFKFWENAAKVYLVTEQFGKAKEILWPKLRDWFEEYKLNGFLPRFFDLQAQFYERMNQPDEASRLRQDSAHLIEIGRKAISLKCFPPEVIQYLNYIVESSKDGQLMEMYHGVRERLTRGFVPEHKTLSDD